EAVRYYLDADKFRKWLAGRELATEHQRPLSLFGCTFAILQPEDALAFFNVLLERSPSFRYWLTDEPATAAPTPLQGPTPGAPAILRGERARTEDQVPGPQLPPGAGPVSTPCPAPVPMHAVTCSSVEGTLYGKGLTIGQVQELLASLRNWRTAQQACGHATEF